VDRSSAELMGPLPNPPIAIRYPAILVVLVVVVVVLVVVLVDVVVVLVVVLVEVVVVLVELVVVVVVVLVEVVVVLVEVVVVVGGLLVEVVVAMIVISVLEVDPSVFNLKHSQHLSDPSPHSPSIGLISISINVRSPWRTSIHDPEPLNAARQEP